MNWQLQDAKARFSEFLDTALREGPQVVTRRGVEGCAGSSGRMAQAAGSGSARIEGIAVG
ncbi:MAG TPA: type II toxin-antitoxin system prevent-host-death family antitoxin [Silvibacterium sp.]|nr:type II toxin-antitoxin system prevent-host-death family antitoxin [Silvibacterium sp.]